MVHLFNVTIKQVILWASSSRYSFASTRCWTFLSQGEGATICSIPKNFPFYCRWNRGDGFNSRQIIGASSASILLSNCRLSLAAIKFGNRSHDSVRSFWNVTWRRAESLLRFSLGRPAERHLKWIVKSSCNSIKPRHQWFHFVLLISIFIASLSSSTTTDRFVVVNDVSGFRDKWLSFSATLSTEDPST